MHEEKKIGCHVCGKEFTSMDKRYVHLKEDHDIKRSEVYSPEFKINAVKRMKEIGLVNAASELHIWESTLVDWQHLIFNPWNCKFCGKAFARENNLKAHVELVHMNVKPYLCGKCGEGYTSYKAKRNKFACEKCDDPLIPAAPEESDAAPADTEDQQGVNLRELFMETFSFNDNDMLQMSHMRTSANRTDLNCESCNKVYTNRDALLKHMKTHYEKFPCQVCGKTFNRPDIQRRHIKTHEKKKTGCHLCGEEFTSMDEKYHHLKEVHDIKRSEIYSQDFKTHAVKRMKDIGLTNAANELYMLESTLADWYRLVFNPLYCTICGKTFARDNKLKDHIELVHVVTKQDANHETPYKIRQETEMNLQELYMQKYFPGENCFGPKGIEGFVEVEMKVGGEEDISANEQSIDDNGEKKAEENHQLIEKEGKNEEMIEEGQFIQTMDDVYPCGACHKTLTTKRGLEKHMIVVHKEKKHYCNICTKAFGRKEHLARHIQDMHNTFDKPYKCDKCDDSFKRKDGLAKHVRFVHNKETNFCCQICTKTFGRKSCLIRHVTDVHEQSGSHVCDFCPKRFLKALDKKSHERRHTGEKPYQCDKCNISYKGLTSLKKHVKTCIGDSKNKQGMQKQSSEVYIDQHQSFVEMKGESDVEISAKEEPMDDIKEINAEEIEDEYEFFDIADADLETNG